MSISVQSNSYHIYAVRGAQDCSLFIDYIAEDVVGHEFNLRKRLRNSHHECLTEWRAHRRIKNDDIFEIECVDSLSAAQEAVLFWRDYFKTYDERIVKAVHLCDRLT